MCSQYTICHLVTVFMMVNLLWSHSHSSQQNLLVPICTFRVKRSLIIPHILTFGNVPTYCMNANPHKPCSNTIISLHKSHYSLCNLVSLMPIFHWSQTTPGNSKVYTNKIALDNAHFPLPYTLFNRYLKV